jgi:hypothetical protein
MTWLQGLILGACALASGVVVLSVLGAKRWAAMSRGLTSSLEAEGCAEPATLTPMRPIRYDPAELVGLPDPVQRYFRAVLKEGQPIIAAATVMLAGKFNLSATRELWRPFTSRQRIITRPAGFVWDAHMPLLPGVAVRVVDSYIAGQGLLRAALLGLFTVAEGHGGGEIGRGEFLRYLAEAAWYPTALLPSQGVRWEAVDDASASATMVDGTFTLSLTFSFNADGLIDSFHADARGCGMGKEMVMLPWEGRWSDYRPCSGMLVPYEGEVSWVRPEGRRSYFRGSVTSVRYALIA